MSYTKIEPRVRFQLRKTDKSDLHRYLFLDEEHARKWLSQRFVNDRIYSIAIVPAVEYRSVERAARVLKVFTVMKPSEFLKSTFDFSLMYKPDENI